jgi:hypothetical protein
MVGPIAGKVIKEKLSYRKVFARSQESDEPREGIAMPPPT